MTLQRAVRLKMQLCRYRLGSAMRTPIIPHRAMLVELSLASDCRVFRNLHCWEPYLPLARGRDVNERRGEERRGEERRGEESRERRGAEKGAERRGEERRTVTEQSAVTTHLCNQQFCTNADPQNLQSAM